VTEFAIVVPWFDDKQINMFVAEWGLRAADLPEWLILQQDVNRAGCGATKNKGVARAVELGAEVVVVLDDDCFPASPEEANLWRHAQEHIQALKPQQVEMFQVVTDPPSRGTPYGELTVEMPVAASMGFWTGIGDYDAARQLVYKGAPMTFDRRPVFGRYFPLCGMNLAFRPRDWLPYCQFVDVPRFDDIWMGWMWQRAAYDSQHCLNLGGPLVRHARQSNAWNNLRVEAQYAEASDELWKKIAVCPDSSYYSLSRLLPPHAGGTDR